MASPLPLKLVNFNVYDSGNKMLGVATIKLPTIAFMSDETKGAGIAGSIDFPVIGHLNDMTTTISFFQPTEETLSLLAPVAKMIKARAGVQSYAQDASGSALAITPNRVEMQTIPKSFEPGTYDIASKNDVSVELTVLSLSYYINNKRWLHADKTGMVYEVNGIDYLTDLRNAI